MWTSLIYRNTRCSGIGEAVYGTVWYDVWYGVIRYRFRILRTTLTFGSTTSTVPAANGSYNLVVWQLLLDARHCTLIQNTGILTICDMHTIEP